MSSTVVYDPLAFVLLWLRLWLSPPKELRNLQAIRKKGSRTGTHKQNLFSLSVSWSPRLEKFVACEVLPSPSAFSFDIDFGVVKIRWFCGTGRENEQASAGS